MPDQPSNWTPEEVEKFRSTRPPIVTQAEVRDPETGQTEQELAEMGWPMTAEPIADPIEGDLSRLKRAQAEVNAAWEEHKKE